MLTITIQDSLDNVHSIRYEFFMLKGAPDYQFDTNGNGQGDLPDDFYLHRNVPFTAPGKPDKRADGLSCAEKLQVRSLSSFAFIFSINIKGSLIKMKEKPECFIPLQHTLKYFFIEISLQQIICFINTIIP